MKTTVLIIPALLLTVYFSFGQNGLAVPDPIPRIDSITLPLGWVQEAERLFRDYDILKEQFTAQAEENKHLRAGLAVKVRQEEVNQEIIDNLKKIIRTQRKLNTWEKIGFGLGGATVGVSIGIVISTLLN